MGRVKVVTAICSILLMIGLLLVVVRFGNRLLFPNALGATAGANPPAQSAPNSLLTTATIVTFLPSVLAQLPVPTATPVPPPTPVPTATPGSTATTFYVSKTGANLDGRSWATAWTDLDQIKWEAIQPGNIILVDGGSTVMTYTSSLEIGQSGTSGLPITIKLADQPGRNGKVVIFGGRSTRLPDCDQPNYTYQTDSVRLRGIDVGDHSWLVIDGSKWRGITIYGHNEMGMAMGAGSSNVTVRNVEIYDNGQAYQSNGLWYPDNPGVTFSGTNNTFERAIIHDNGQDAFQSGGGIANFTLRESWLYNSRQHLGKGAGISFNYCSHSDGIQIYDGGTQTDLLLEWSIIGPGLTNGVILGDPGGSGGVRTQINAVVIRNALFINATDNNILGDIGLKPQNWRIENVTSFLTPLSATGEGSCGLELDGSGHVVTNSIFKSGCFYVPDGIATASGNCYWQTSDAVPGGQELDPLFVGPIPPVANPTLDQLAGINYSLQATSACFGKGSSLTSVAELLDLQAPISLPTK